MTDPREMQAGPELDAAIAREIFGWDEKAIEAGVMPYSSDPAASAELRAKLWAMDYTLKIAWHFSFVRVSLGDDSCAATADIIDDDPRPAEYLAVAKAALKAVRARKAGAA